MGGKWRTIRLGEACVKIGSGATPRGGSAVYLDRGPYALIRSQNVHNDGFRTEGLAFIADESAASLANVTVCEGDVLINITGNSVARACMVDPRVLPARVNQHVAIVRPDPTKLDPLFLRYALVEARMQAHLLSLASAGATRDALTKQMIEALEVRAPVCPKAQRAIAHILGTLDDKIELNRRQNETLEGIARALFKSWFVDFDPVHTQPAAHPPPLPPSLTPLFPSRLVDSELGPIPEGWRVAALGEVLTPSLERIGAQSAPEYSSTNQGLVPRADRYKKALAASKANNKLVRAGYLVFGLSRQVLNFGLMTDPLGSVSAAYRVFAVDAATMDPSLLYRIMRSNPGYYYNAVGASSREGQSVSDEGVGRLMFVCPPRDVQAAYERATRPLYARIEAMQHESETLAATRDALLPRLLAGKLDLDWAQRSGGDM